MHKFFTLSRPGSNSTNEDAFATRLHPADPSLLICVLADGQGGRSGARAAAQLACESVADAAAESSLRQITRTQSWTKILAAADRQVSESPDAGFTTLVALCISQNTVYGASCGDSAALLFNTRDRMHTITEFQKKNPPVGSGSADIVTFQEELIAPWQILIMSDGVWKYVGWNRVRTLAIRHTGQEVVDALQQAARKAGNGQLRDDLTLIVVHSVPEDEASETRS